MVKNFTSNISLGSCPGKTLIADQQMSDLLFSTLYLPHRSHVEYEFRLSFSNLQLKRVKHIISFVGCFVICRIYLKQIMFNTDYS